MIRPPLQTKPTYTTKPTLSFGNLFLLSLHFHVKPFSIFREAFPPSEIKQQNLLCSSHQFAFKDWIWKFWNIFTCPTKQPIPVIYKPWPKNFPLCGIYPPSLTFDDMQRKDARQSEGAGLAGQQGYLHYHHHPHRRHHHLNLLIIMITNGHWPSSAMPHHINASGGFSRKACRQGFYHSYRRCPFHHRPCCYRHLLILFLSQVSWFTKGGCGDRLNRRNRVGMTKIIDKFE